MTDSERLDQVMIDLRNNAFRSTNIKTEVEKISDPELKAKAESKVTQLENSHDNFVQEYTKPLINGDVVNLSVLSNTNDVEARAKQADLTKNKKGIWLRQTFLNTMHTADKLSGGGGKGKPSDAYLINAASKNIATHVLHVYDATVKKTSEMLEKNGLKMSGNTDNKSLSKYMAVLEAKDRNKILRERRRAEAEKIATKEAKKEAKKSGKKFDPNDVKVKVDSMTNEELIALDEKIEDGYNGSLYAGISDEDIDVYMKEITENGDIEFLEIGKEAMRVEADKVSNLDFTSGRIGEKEYFDRKKTHPNWVPLKVKKDKGHKPLTPSVGQSSAKSKSFRGSKRTLDERVDVVEGIRNELSSSARNAEFNKGQIAWLKSFFENGVFDGENIKVVKIDGKERLSRADEEGELSRVGTKDFSHDDNKGIPFYVNGERWEAIIQDKMLFESMTQMRLRMPQWYTASVGSMLGKMKSTYTTYNPGFIFKNMFRDLHYGYMRLDALGVKGVSTVEWTKEVAKVKTTTSLLRQYNNSGKIEEKTEEGELFTEMMENGGISNFSDYVNENNVSDVERKIKEVLYHPSNWKTNPLSTLTAGLEVIKAVADITETNTRFAAYKLAKKRGLSPTEAAHVSREITVDFTRGGKWSGVMNSLYMFSNVSLQGVESFASTMMHSAKGRRIAIQSMGMTVLLGMLNELIDKEGMESISEFDKRKNFILMNPFSDKKGDYIKIPTAPGLDGLNYLVVKSAEYAKGDISGAEAVSAMGEKLLDGYVPIQGQSFLNAVAPSAVDPILSYGLNQDWHGGEIYTDQNKYGAFDVTDAFSGKESTPQGYKNFAEALSGLSLGNKFTEAYGPDLKPEFFQYFAKSYIGPYATWTDNLLRYWGGVLPNDDSEKSGWDFTKKTLTSPFYSEGQDLKQKRQREISKVHKAGYSSRTSEEDINIAMEKVKSLVSEFKLTPKESKRLYKQYGSLLKQAGEKRNNLIEVLGNKNIEVRDANHLDRILGGGM
jgi:hypothetical protein